MEAEIKQSNTIQENIKLVVLELERIKTKCESPKKRVSLESIRVTRSTTPSRSPPLTLETTQSTLINPRTEDPSTIFSTTVSGDTEQPTQVKLPKLTRRLFNGNLTMWTTFWELFESAVHKNPSQSNIDKFNYLNSLLDQSAADAIVGLPLTSSNYEEAIDILKQRFGNKQLIINRHMEALLQLIAVTSSTNLKNLRLYDTVESHVRGLKSLRISATSYGSLLSSVLINKLPLEFQLIIRTTVTGENWELDMLLQIVEMEISARERSETVSVHRTPQNQRSVPTAIFMSDTVNQDLLAKIKFGGIVKFYN